MEDSVTFQKLLHRTEMLEKRVELLEKRQKPSAWMGVDEFCAETGYQESTAYKLSCQRAFTTRRAGKLQFKRSEVEEFLKDRIRQRA